ncbi:hypothetical protein [Komagataeibacter saccharivorans]|uniref:hypothetical protein n=1 Tax=Komagataeibacter saccharivorans TaxID=265959 RepID=UPI000C84AA23|nr:hypothetical protein [Komagataeibacter saccharivorans]
MTSTSDAAEPDYLATRLTWMQQVGLHMRAHNSAPLNARQMQRLTFARNNGLTPWEAFTQIVGTDHVQF